MIAVIVAAVAVILGALAFIAAHWVLSDVAVNGTVGGVCLVASAGLMYAVWRILRQAAQ